MKTALVNLLILVGVVALAIMSFGWKDASAETAPSVVTNSKLSFASPTLAPSNTPLPTVTPTATRTQAPTWEPSPTRDLSALATEQAIMLEAQATRISLGAMETETMVYGMWETTKAVGVIALMLVAFVAIGTAYARSMRGDFKKTAQDGVQAHTQPTQPDLPEARLMKAGYANKTVLGFCRRLEELEGIYTASMESKFYPEPLPDQASLRELVRLMKSFDLLARIDGGWELSVEGWNMLGRLTP